MNARTLTIAIACFLATMARFDAQAPSNGQPQQPPIFRAGVQLVEIDVSVTDGRNELVRNLTKEDFELLEDGKPQTISSFSFLDLPLEEPPTPGAPESVAADIASNMTEGRMYVMLLDCCAPIFGATADGSSLRPSGWASSFVDRAMRSNDMMAVVHVHGNISDGQPFTGNKALLKASIDRYVSASAIGAGGGSDVDRCQQISEKLLKLRNTYQAIEDISERLGGVSGRRKAILWVNGNIPFDPNVEFGVSDPNLANPANAANSSTSSNPSCTGASQASSAAFMHRDAIRAATRNNVAIYPIDPGGLTTGLGAGELSRVAALRGVAEDTGGDILAGTNNNLPVFERIVRHNSTYYLLGYYPAVEHRDGKFHNVTVRVKKRPDLTVRAKRGYFAPTSESKATEPATLVEGLSPSGRGALRSPAPVRGLGIELFAAPFKGSEKSASVVLGAQLRGSDLRLGAGEQVEISYIPIDRQGKIGTGSRKVFTLNFKPETRAQVEESGLRFIDRLDLPPGRHELRFAVHQPSGATGSVVAQVEVPDFAKEPFVLSGVLLASASASPYTLLSDAPIKTTMSTDPAATRRFVRDDELSVYAELYMTVTLPPEQIDVTFTVVSEAGEMVRDEPGWPDPNDKAGKSGRVGYTAQVSLVDLRPGKYILTALARSLDGLHEDVRQIPFSIETSSVTSAPATKP
jgi:VWFA-related protein